MTFNESLQAMLKDKGIVVEDGGELYRLCNRYSIKDWRIANTPTVGALLTRYGKPYRLIKETKGTGTYAILNAETYVEKFKGITKENLMRDLMYYDFGIAKQHKIN